MLKMLRLYRTEQMKTRLLIGDKWQGDEWVLPAGLVQHMADVTIGATRGILAMRSEENGLPRIILPMMAAAQFVKTNLSLKRTPQAPTT